MSEVTFNLDRLEHDGLATRGELSVNGRLLCLTLEDRFRAGPKVPGTTRIPAGLYALELKPLGSSRFDKVAAEIMAAAGLKHHGMVRLVGVPNFSEVLFHWGNDQYDTEGCLISGLIKMKSPKDGSLAVGQSRIAYRKAYPELARAAHAAGPGAWIRISDKDGTGGGTGDGTGGKAAPLPLARPERNGR